MQAVPMCSYRTGSIGLSAIILNTMDSPMKKLSSFALGVTLSLMAGAASATGGIPSSVCYVKGKMVSTNMPVNICQSVLKGDPQKDRSFKD